MSFSFSIPETSSPSSEEVLSLPSYAQNELPDLDLPKLILISHAHSPPLNPAPQLRFDLRNLPNPPKRIRDAHVGTSKRLQEWMEADPAFLARLEEIREEIREAMDGLIRRHEKKEVLRVDVDEEPKEKDRGYEHDEGPVVNGDSQKKTEEDESGYRRVYNEQDFSGLELRVGIVCAMGRHRSVAMVEELSRVSWPGWDVEVEHRDVAKKRGTGGGKSGGKGSRGTRGSFASYSTNDDSE
ncbi:uncharacterized protein LY89DRAFT_721940 [Mollisia scopiformis]|uniref:RapZ C-terminal domain-containing protein n=1 Tax=Mollisia scopiformis TaxID=149040 RepID=A0A194WX75_MOLSC|nr:uncharacterized protein LY89DRAFT_721940 [Mollisia scopiformis]KUJ12279.1 hypothetical protein LY89DRAFT_721940 [Mollisia scopiformis]